MVDLPDYSPPSDCRPAARVTVGDNRIPIINDGVSTQIRKDGPTDISRYSEVYFPAQWIDGNDYSVLFEPASDAEELLEIATQAGLGGTDFAAAISEPLSQEGEGLDEIVDVEYLDHVNDEYVLAHRGYVGGIGGGSGSSNELRLSVNDPSKFLGMPASFSWSWEGEIPAVFEYIRDTVEANQPIFDDIPIVYSFDEGIDVDGSDDVDTGTLDPSVDLSGGDDAPITSGEIFEAQIERGSDLDVVSGEEFQFSRNRDTLEDMVSKIIEKWGLYVWFEPYTENRICLFVTNEPHDYFTAHSGGNGDEDIDLQKNDALYQLSPINALEVRGETKKRDISETATPDITQAYPYAIIQHDTAVERAGGQMIQEYESDRTSEDGVIADGKRELKKRMDSTGRGSMTAEIAPQMKPFDVLAARPVCGDVAANVPILSWEIENLTHTASASQRPSTELQVSPTVKRDDLTVVESGYREA